MAHESNTRIGIQITVCISTMGEENVVMVHDEAVPHLGTVEEYLNPISMESGGATLHGIACTCSRRALLTDTRYVLKRRWATDHIRNGGRTVEAPMF
jgi:hypothetical protein